MGFPQRYDATEAERRWQATWARERIYEFAFSDSRPIFAIDTPPPTVSGELHIGHVYSYVQAEAMARFWRMQGYNVYYPFGFDDNGLPTERFVERYRGIKARDVGRTRFIATCLEVSREVEDRFEGFWKSLGMSIDWRLRYSTIDPVARRTSQWSFLDLYRKGLIYRAQAPNPWCVECQTAIAQAEMEDADRTTTFYTLAFQIAENQEPRTENQGPGDEEARYDDVASRQADKQIDGQEDALTSNPQSAFAHLRSPILPIATTRPELLPACVAVFVHPDDTRFAHLIGQAAITPLFERRVSILADTAVDPAKGSGAVMCCTFGDLADVEWWRTHHLPLIPLVTRQGRMSADGGPYEGLTLGTARQRIIADLRAAELLLDARETAQSVRVHERCGTPLEILETKQWFIRIRDAKAALLDAGRRIIWRPAHMRTRYEHWVEHLSWDWCISRQRFYGVPFPVWHCERCGEAVLADESQLPVDPTLSAPPRACSCGNADLRPEEDVMDTWATSSVSPQIAARLLDDPALHARLFPMAMRPQAHDIIRTWAFYTIVKSHYHFGTIPWATLMISGHGLDPSGHSIHKSKGNSPVDPLVLIGRYGADAIRYWACEGSVGADQPVSEAMMKQGGRLVTKLWNAARFVAGHLHDFEPSAVGRHTGLLLQPADRALLSWLQRLIARTTESFREYEYAAAKDATERFFWGTLCDNYLEWVKGRLYDAGGEERRAAQYTLYHALLAILKLFAPIMPHVTEEIYMHVFAQHEGAGSIHVSAWPQPDETLIDEAAERVGEALLAITTSVRRFKSAQKLGLGAELERLNIALSDTSLRSRLESATGDLRSVTRAREIAFTAVEGDAGVEEIAPGLWVRVDA